MESTEKTAIKTDLQQYVARKGSQQKASRTLGISSATLSQMLNDNWGLITADMWRTVAAGVKQTEWQVVETRDFKILTKLLTDAQQYSNVFAVTGAAGTGKSIALKHFADNNPQAFLIRCNEYWNRKYFLIELLTVMGRDASGMSVNELMAEAVRQLKKQQAALLIFDEADKLTDQVLYFFITLYNNLEDHCGIVLAATDHLEKRLRKGLRLNRKGYNEIYSRIGRKCIELPGCGITDITQVCMANGISDKAIIRDVIDDCEGDLRRVKRKIHALKQSANAKIHAA